ncbi:MAG TPA: hypothetical protein VGH99_13905 [Pseudonocardia sp.]|jgi:vacuolar-type H+-ATPase subunit H
MALGTRPGGDAAPAEVDRGVPGQPPDQARTDEPTQPAGPDAGARPEFEREWRGYDRRQVDEYVAVLEERASTLSERLHAHEQRISEQLSAANDEAQHILDQAQREADRLRDETRAQLENEYTAIQRGIRERHAAAEQEQARLARLRDDLHRQLTRLHAVLAAELGLPPRPAPPAPDIPAQATQAGPAPARPTPYPRQVRRQGPQAQPVAMQAQPPGPPTQPHPAPSRPQG